MNDDRQMTNEERLREALETIVQTCKLQRDVIEKGKYAAAWNPVIEGCEKVLKETQR